MKEIKTPKNIYLNRDGFQVSFWSKKLNKNIYCGIYESMGEAVKARDIFICENIHDVLFGYVPRGITRDRNKFRAYLYVNKEKISIGNFTNIKEAIDYRNSYIDSLK